MLGLLVIPLGWNLATAAPSLAPSDSHQAREVVVNIKTRQFQPDTLYFQAGEKIRLILRNQDVELHAFVPISLFQNAPYMSAGMELLNLGLKDFFEYCFPHKGRPKFCSFLNAPVAIRFFATFRDML